MSLVQFRPEAPFADLAHLVERDLAKVEVAGSSPVIRSKQMGFGYPEPIFIRRHSQAVRQRSAKPLFPGPIPGGASIPRVQFGSHLKNGEFSPFFFVFRRFSHVFKNRVLCSTNGSHFGFDGSYPELDWGTGFKKGAFCLFTNHYFPV